jgi:hypothetical protein
MRVSGYPENRGNRMGMMMAIRDSGHELPGKQGRMVG